VISVEALIFDLDGTLIDSTRDLADSVRFLQHQLGLRPSSDAQVASFIGDGVVRLVQRAIPGVKGHSLPDAVARFKRYYHLHCLDTTRLYPGVVETLRHFRHKKLAVVTNKPARVSRHILENLGVLSRFQLVLGGDSLRSKKPDPHPILYALKAMKVHEPRSAVVVGDGPNDVLAGRAAGTFTCGILSKIGVQGALKASHPEFMVLNTPELMRIFN
jgi:phosphoglycolate phosphatase